MAFPTTNAQTELIAINSILASCGQAPVTTLDQTNPDVALVYDTLLEVNREVQAEGWSFNKEFEYEIVVNNDKQYEIPNNMLQIDLSKVATGTTIALNTTKDVVRRDGKLYDRANHKYEIADAAGDKLKADVVWLFDWVDLPQPIKDHITARAATIASSRIVGDSNLYQMLQQKEAYTRAMAIEYECNQGDYTYFGHSGQTNNYISYKPFRALYR